MNVKFTAQNFYKSSILKKGLKFASENSSLFLAGTSLALSTVVRPLAIMATPDTDIENKKILCAKSFASAGIGYAMMFAVSTPFAKGIKRIDKTPSKYLKQATIENLQNGEKVLKDSKAYQLATQIFKLGLGLAMAIPKAFLVNATIPPIMNNVFNKKNENIKNNNAKNISFSHNILAKNIGKVIDTDFVQKNANRFKDTNFPMHTMALTDIFATGAFIWQTNKNKKIDEKQKQILNSNAIISTGLCLAGGYILDKVLEKPTEKFIENFSIANKNDKNLAKYVEGIKIIKPALIMGGIYYAIIPMLSTFLAEKTNKKNSQ